MQGLLGSGKFVETLAAEAEAKLFFLVYMQHWETVSLNRVGQQIYFFGDLCLWHPYFEVNEEAGSPLWRWKPPARSKNGCNLVCCKHVGAAHKDTGVLTHNWKVKLWL